MTSNPNHINIRQLVSAIFMFLLLSWLTVCLPVVTEAQNAGKSEQTSNDVDNDNPLANTTEEKTPNPTNIAEEYIHQSAHDLSLSPFQVSVAYIYAHESTYKAYHGEPPCPPPNFLA